MITDQSEKEGDEKHRNTKGNHQKKDGLENKLTNRLAIYTRSDQLVVK